MSEFVLNGIERVKSVFDVSSVVLALVYTMGHIIIAMICVSVITGAPIQLAAMSALIEPMINGVWFFILHSIYKSR